MVPPTAGVTANDARRALTGQFRESACLARMVGRIINTAGESVGLSRHEKYRGKPCAATFDGKFSDDHYEGNGRVGRRDCALTMARK